MMLLYYVQRDGLCDVVECRDMPQWTEYCARWAADGRCTDDPLLMATNCARTCNLCKTPQPATTAAPPVSQNLTTTQQSTSLLYTHDGINVTTTPNRQTLTSSLVSTQSPVNVMFNSSLLTSVSVGGTLAGSAVSDVSTQSSVSSTSAVRSVNTDTLTASNVLSTLLTSDASKRDMTSASHSVSEVNDTSVRQSVTSPYTDVITTLRRASHSSLGAVSSSKRTIADSATTDSNMTTARQRVWSVTSASISSHPLGRLATSAPVSATSITTPHRKSQQIETNIAQQTEALKSADSFTAEMILTSSVHANTAEDYLSSSFTSTQDAADAPATVTTSTTSGHVDVSVTSRSDVISAAEEEMSRDGMMTSSSFSSVSDAADETFSLLPPMSTQSPVNVVSNSSLLTSVSVGGTLAGSAVSDVSTQSSLSSTSAVRNVHTDTLTASSVLSTLLTSDASKRYMTSASHRVAAANDTSVRQFVTSPYTDIITSLRRASHSTLGAISSSKRTMVGLDRTIADRATTDTNVTTARQRVVSVTSASTTPHRPSHLATSGTTSRVRGHLATRISQKTDARTSAESFNTEITMSSFVHAINTPEDYSSSFLNSTHDATYALANVSTNTTRGHTDASVTSQTDANLTADAAEGVPRDGMVTSSSFSSVSDAADETVSRLSPMSTQSPVNVVSDSSLLTSVSVGGTLAGSAVSDVSTQSSVSSTLAVRNVHTDTLTASGTLSTLLTSDASKHDTTSASHRVASANNSSVKQSVTSPYTDVITTLRRASHSSLGAISSSKRITVAHHRTLADSAATDSNVTAVRQRVESVTSSNINAITSHRPSHLATSTTTWHRTRRLQPTPPRRTDPFT